MSVSTLLTRAGLSHLSPNLGELSVPGFKSLLIQDYDKYGITDARDKQALFRLIKLLESDDLRATPPVRGAGGLVDLEVEDEAFLSDNLGDMRGFSAQQALFSSPAQVPGGAAAAVPGRESRLGGSGGPDPGGARASAARHHAHAHPTTIAGAIRDAAEDAAEEEASFGELGANVTGAGDGAEDEPALLSAPDAQKIRVIVRKRPLNSKELERGEQDVLEVDDEAPGTMYVNEPKVKVDLTRFVERHTFRFDDVFDEMVENEQLYWQGVRPLLAAALRGGKATCFAYGQTGSGKTYTMAPLPIRAAADVLEALRHPNWRDVKLHVSCYEIYGGKLYDLLNDRNKLEVREDAKRRVRIVGLADAVVHEASEIAALCAAAAQQRSTGSTGANDESSRSHSIMQLALRREAARATKPQRSGAVPVAAPKSTLIGKVSFIDLAGSERGADTYDNDKQTRLEGAEINKSLLALKECIRALDSDARHIPFRGSKLTEVLRDSFVGSAARTVMIANVSPNATSCEHTLNTLRYADRVKEIRKAAAPPAAGTAAWPPAAATPGMGGSSAASMAAALAEATNQLASSQLAGRAAPTGRPGTAGGGGPGAVAARKGGADLPANVTGGTAAAAAAADRELAAELDRASRLQQRNKAERESRVAAEQERLAERERREREKAAERLAAAEEKRRDRKGATTGPVLDDRERRAAIREEGRARKEPAGPRAADTGPAPAGSRAAPAAAPTAPNGGHATIAAVDPAVAAHPSQNPLRRSLPDPGGSIDESLAALAAAEDDLVAAHRAHIEDCMGYVREEMNLLRELDSPDGPGDIEGYASELASVLAEKSAAVSSLQLKVIQFRRLMQATLERHGVSGGGQ